MKKIAEVFMYKLILLMRRKQNILESDVSAYFDAIDGYSVAGKYVCPDGPTGTCTYYGYAVDTEKEITSYI